MQKIVLRAALTLLAMAAASTASMAATAPSVAVRVNKDKALVDEPVNVRWDSVGTTGCTASGAWSGALATSGTMKLTFGALGVKSLVVTCATGTSPVTASTVVKVYAVKTYTHPVDPLATAYPAGYRAASTRAADVFQDNCSAGPTTVTTPRGWAGRYRVALPVGAPLAAGIQRGMGLKDVWEPDNPMFDPVCAGKAGTTARAEFTRTATRLKALGVDFISLIPWTAVGKNADGSWKVMPVAALNTSSMNDDDLKWAVGEAHRIGLKVTWISQIGLRFNGSAFEVVPQTRDSVSKFMTAYEPFLLERAAFLQRIRADTMTVSCQCFTILEGNDFADIYVPAMARILPKVRKIFKGRIRMLIHPAIMKQPGIHDSIDEVVVGLYWNITPAEAPTLTLPQMKAKLADSMQGYTVGYPGFDKPVDFTIDVPSRADFYTTGYLEETFCTAGYGAVTNADSKCIQRDKVTDFSLQAQHVEAYFETIKAQTKFTVRSVEVTGYWMVDSLTPRSTFPNIAYSVRNKPAEGVVKAWFKR